MAEEEVKTTEEKPQQEAEASEKAEQKTEGYPKAIGESELIKKLEAQEQRIIEGRKLMAKERLALNAQKREIELSGKSFINPPEEDKEETGKEYVDRLMRGEYTDKEKRALGLIP